tara:strand:- start:348 stop:560 length:213 start_codon:yes stop_codon:yes gene_type:complete
MGLPQFTPYHPNQTSQIDFSNGECRPSGVRKDVSKTFKKLITSNFHRTSINTPGKDLAGDETSTKWGGSY